MTEFLKEIAARIEAARRSLVEARDAGDDYLVSVRIGEIESLERLVEEHRSQNVIDVAGRPPVILLEHPGAPVAR